MKSNRHERIKEIIKKNQVETQEELILSLRESGFNVTQATVSRDIRDLKLTKTANSEGKYVYTAPRSASDKSDVYTDMLSRSIKKAAVSVNIVVVHTYPGMASAAAAEIDSHDSADILGCVAGDDTIIIVLDGVEKAKEYHEKILSLIS